MNPVIAMLIGVVVMMVLVICTRMHAFPSLIISAILIAVLSGNYLLVGTGNEGGNLLSVAISTVTGGFGGTMTSIGIVIGFGCIMGIFLEKSGAAKRMAITILKLVGVKRADVVLGLTGFVVSIPVFCDSGFVILSSLAKEFSRLTKKSMVGLGGILGMGLYITHFMVPPTPRTKASTLTLACSSSPVCCSPSPCSSSPCSCSAGSATSTRSSSFLTRSTAASTPKLS